MSVELQALYAHCEQSPGDLTCYGALADELDGLGYPAIAHAFRWMHTRGKFPHLRKQYVVQLRPLVLGRTVSTGVKWAWYAEWEHNPKLRKSYPIPDWKVHTLPGLLLVGEQRVFRTHQEAVMHLAAALTKVGNTYNCDPPKPKGLPLIDVLDVLEPGIRVPPTWLAGEGEQNEPS